jgi:hypothetical protein
LNFSGRSKRLNSTTGGGIMLTTKNRRKINHRLNVRGYGRLDPKNSGDRKNIGRISC